MSDRFSRRIFRAIAEGRNLSSQEADHLAGCETCRAAANRAAAFNDELTASLRDQRLEPMPADPLAEPAAPRRRQWTAPALSAALVLLVAGGAFAGSRLLVRPTVLATPSPSVMPSRSTPNPSALPIIAAVKPGDLAQVRGPANVVAAPGGTVFGQVEQDQSVLVVDKAEQADTTWWRIEFEYCCRADAPNREWVFGWVAADLATASSQQRSHDDPNDRSGPTLEGESWACPAAPEGLDAIPLPVRWRCYPANDSVTIRGLLSDYPSDPSRALYPGDPADLTGPPTAGLIQAGTGLGEVLPLHISADPVLVAWFNDQRVKDGDEVSVTGHFGPGAVACAKSPRIAGFPPMSAADADLWCQQQFTVTRIEAVGGDPIVPAPNATPAWTAPPGAQARTGDGWRLLASADRFQVAITVESSSVAVATTPQEYPALWLSVAHGTAPAVDFDRQFVVRFVPAVSGSCPWIAFRGIGVNSPEHRLYGRFETLPPQVFIDNVPSTFGCTTDATPHAFLVAIDRSLAPAPSFTLRLRDTPACDGCGITTDETTVDLGRP